MGIISWIIFGLVAGAIAKFIMPGKDPGGWIVTILLGVAGSSIGGFIGSKFLDVNAGTSEFSLSNMGLAVLGALLLLGIYRLVMKNR